MMRNSDRIDPILAQLGAAWKANPDMRLAQLVWALVKSDETAPQFFYAEDVALHWEDVPVAAPEWDGSYWLGVS